MSRSQTFFEKVWDDHVVSSLGDDNYLIGIDRVVWHEGFVRVLSKLKKSGHKIARPDLIFTTIDHTAMTYPGRDTSKGKTQHGVEWMNGIKEASEAYGFRFFGLGDRRQGVIHVMATETGVALPGTTLVTGDSHTCTIGGIGALGWGIGGNEGEHALVTQTLYQAKPKTMRVAFEGKLPDRISAKDMVMNLIGKIGAQGGIGYAVEFGGSAIRSLPIEGRLTICNMSIEFSASYGFVAPDDLTYQYLSRGEFSPKGQAWDKSLAYWRTLPTDDDARFDKEVVIDCSLLKPQVTWGTSPQQVAAIDDRVPDPSQEGDSGIRTMMERALGYMDLKPGTPLASIPIDVAYIGSCTNARLSDLQEAAQILKGHKVADGIQALIEPGSTAVKLAAEAEGLHTVFKDAGFAWHESGCGYCNIMGGSGYAGLRTISTTNRSFENRQGTGTRTHLASPATVAASAITGRITDPRHLAN